MNITIKELLEKDIAFMGSDWQPDPTAKDSPIPGQRYVGEKPCILCNDVFYWGCADSEDINEDLLIEFQKAAEDCGNELQLGAMLYCARRRKERPQGAIYSSIPKDLWHLFDECGLERKINAGNPCKPGESLKMKK